MYDFDSPLHRTSENGERKSPIFARDMLRIGVLGAGHLGKIHLRLLKEIPEFDIIGFYDPDDSTAEQIVEQFGIQRFREVSELINSVDCVDIVTPTLSHFECAAQALRKGKHIFIEKPMTNTIGEARQLMELVEEADVKAQIGHVERFNPAFLAVKDIGLSPMFIESHRLAQFNPRGTDVPVILDLMVHDIDIVLSVVNANVRHISASGVAIVSNSPDIANARIEFDNGCVANLTASRISLKQMRKMRLFQHDAYITIDFLKKESQVFRLYDYKGEDAPDGFVINPGGEFGQKVIRFETPEILPINAIKMELEMFHKCIVEDTEPPVTVIDGYRSLQIAHEILEQVERRAFVH